MPSNHEKLLGLDWIVKSRNFVKIHPSRLTQKNKNLEDFFDRLIFQDLKVHLLSRKNKLPKRCHCKRTRKTFKYKKSCILPKPICKTYLGVFTNFPQPSLLDLIIEMKCMRMKCFTKLLPKP